MTGQEIAGELYNVGGPGFTEEESRAIAFRELYGIAPSTCQQMID